MGKAIAILVLLPITCWISLRYLAAQRQCQAVATLRSHGGQVIYQNEADRMTGPFIPHPEYPGPRFLHPILGVDFFDTISTVNIGPKFDMKKIACLDHLVGLRNVCFVNNRIDVHEVTVCKFPQSLKMVSFTGLVIRDDNITQLLKFKNLESLIIWTERDALSDRSVDTLLQLEKLKYLRIGDESNLSAAGFARLRKGLPHCEIEGKVYTPRKPGPKPILELEIR